MVFFIYIFYYTHLTRSTDYFIGGNDVMNILVFMGLSKGKSMKLPTKEKERFLKKKKKIKVEGEPLL